MKYYAVVQLNISNDSWMADYMSNVTPLVHKHGGNYLARTTTMQKVQGTEKLPDAIVIIEWPSKQAAEAFYEDPPYQPYLRNRLAGSSSEFTLVAGEDIAGA